MVPLPLALVPMIAIVSGVFGTAVYVLGKKAIEVGRENSMRRKSAFTKIDASPVKTHQIL